MRSFIAAAIFVLAASTSVQAAEISEFANGSGTVSAELPDGAERLGDLNWMFGKSEDGTPKCVMHITPLGDYPADQAVRDLIPPKAEGIDTVKLVEFTDAKSSGWDSRYMWLGIRESDKTTHMNMTQAKEGRGVAFGLTSLATDFDFCNKALYGAATTLRIAD